METNGISNRAHLVIGLGEVGQALQKIFKCDGEDKYKNIFASEPQYKLLHIAFPYSDKFIDEVKFYQDKYKPKFTVIHSSVPIGTSRKLNATHSPIRGVHPHLEEGIYIFKKFVGGPDAFEIANIFKPFRINCLCTLKQENTEAGKLWDTTQYGVMILLNKEIKEFCDANGLDFNIVYEIFNETYNDGYLKSFRPEVVRPYLKYMEGKIGGHCVVQNAKLLDSESAKRIINKNAGF